MTGGDVGPCGYEVLGYGLDVGEAPGDDGVGEQSDSFALDVLAAGVSPAELPLARRRAAASLTSSISCSTDVATSAWVRVGTIRSTEPSKTLRIGITTAPVVPSTKTPTPLLPTPQHLPLARIRRDAPTRSPRRRPP